MKNNKQEKIVQKTENRKQISNFSLNQENPFLNHIIEEVDENIFKKYKTATKTDEKTILKAFDENTFIRQTEVEQEEFAKVYLSNFSAFFDLKEQAIKVFGYILTLITPDKNEFIFIHQDCLKHTKYKSGTSIRIGLTSLLEKQIIARGRTEFFYFINPMVAFNENGVTFKKTYVKKNKNTDS